MKKIIPVTLAAVFAAAFLPACLTPTQTVYTYDAEGHLLSKTEGESVIKSITESTKDKTCITWESGWVAYISASTATTEDPTPTVKMGAGKVDKGAITLHANHAAGLSDIAAIITSTRQELSVTKDGVGATESEKK